MIRKLTTLRSVPLLSPLDQLQCEGPGVFLGATFAGKRCQFTAVRYLRIAAENGWYVSVVTRLRCTTRTSDMVKR